MVKMKHRTRREGGITVRSTRYQLDSEGCVEVTEELHARNLEAAGWIRLGPKLEPRPKPEPVPEPERSRDEPQRLEDMSKSELLDLAIAKGLDVSGRTSKLKLAKLLRESQE